MENIDALVAIVGIITTSVTVLGSLWIHNHYGVEKFRIKADLVKCEEGGQKA